MCSPSILKQVRRVVLSPPHPRCHPHVLRLVDRRVGDGDGRAGAPPLLRAAALPMIPAAQSGSLEIDQGDLCHHRHPVLAFDHSPGVQGIPPPETLPLEEGKRASWRVRRSYAAYLGSGSHAPDSTFAIIPFFSVSRRMISLQECSHSRLSLWLIENPASLSSRCRTMVTLPDASTEMLSTSTSVSRIAR